MKLRLWMVFLVLMVAALAVPVLAHEGREVGDGAFEITFGWRMEPAYTGLFNGPEFTVKLHGAEESHDMAPEATAEAGHNETGSDDHHAADEAMVTGLEDTLKLEVSYGGQSKTLRLRAVWDEPGSYTADLIPTQPGDYSFRLTGTINGVEIDETFASTDGEFSTVEPVSDIQFP